MRDEAVLGYSVDPTQKDIDIIKLCRRLSWQDSVVDWMDMEGT